jgi:hypothetical protein
MSVGRNLGAGGIQEILQTLLLAYHLVTETGSRSGRELFAWLSEIAYSRSDLFPGQWLMILMLLSLTEYVNINDLNIENSNISNFQCMPWKIIQLITRVATNFKLPLIKRNGYESTRVHSGYGQVSRSRTYMAPDRQKKVNMRIRSTISTGRTIFDGI